MIIDTTGWGLEMEAFGREDIANQSAQSFFYFFCLFFIPYFFFNKFYFNFKIVSKK